MKKRPKYILIGAAFFVVIVFALLVVALNNFGPGVADYTYQLTGTCDLGRSSAYQISVYCNDMNQYIPADVMTLGWNSSYIVATTNPLTKTDPKNPNCVNCQPDAFTTYWWIIDLKNKKLYGPLNSQQEFSDEENRLGITNLPLWSVDEAKNHAVLINGDLK